jgi:hypothetical protein
MRFRNSLPRISRINADKPCDNFQGESIFFPRVEFRHLPSTFAAARD